MDPWAECERLLELAGHDASQGSPLELSSAMDLWTKLLDDKRALREQTTLTPSLLTGLGEQFDQHILSGGLHVGEICEVFGPPDIGKTQLGLSIAATHALSGRRVMYIDTKDHPINLAIRMHGIMMANGCSHEEVQAALAVVRIVHTSDFTAFAQALVMKEFPEVLVVDGLSGLLTPYVLVGNDRFSSRHRWRVSWACRALRHLASHSSIAVLVLSHTVSHGSFQSLQLALGQLWADAIGMRLEMSAHQPADENRRNANRQEIQDKHVRISVRKSSRHQIGQSALLTIGRAGVLCAGDEQSDFPMLLAV